MQRFFTLCLGFALIMSFLAAPAASLPAMAQELPPAAPIGAATALAPAQPNAGFTINVNTLVDEWSTDTNTQAQSKCSLREALQATVTGNPAGNQGCGAAAIANIDEYTINLLPGTYLLTRNEQLPNITKKIYIDGKKTVTIDGNGKANRAEGIFIVGGGELILNQLKLQNGLRPFGGAIWIKGGGSARVTEVEFYRNLADNGVGNGDGGAVTVDTGAFYCVKSKFNENTARQSGGAISSGGVQVLLDRCEFFRNHAELNGGAYAGFGGSETTHPIIRDSKFQENWVFQTNVPASWPGQYQFTDDQSGGGALYNKGYMEIERTEFFKNYTQRSKGGGAIYNQGDLRLLDVAIADNKARPDGPVPNTLGGAILNDSTLIVRRTSIHGNEARFGGAIMNRTGGKMWLVNSTVADNLATTGGGVENGYNFIMNGAPMINNGGEVNIWHSTVVRANDNNEESINVGNIGNGYVYMANSVTDSPCAGVISTYGGNIFKKLCQRVSADFNNDKTGLDVIVPSEGPIQLQGLANNGGPNLPNAQFLSVKVGGTSAALDLGQDEYCTDPALQPLFLTNLDQIKAQRPVGPKCDSGALEVGTLPPVWYSDKPEGAGFFFPITIFGKTWSSDQTLLVKNNGGGAINYKMTIENDAGGVYSLVDGPAEGGLGKDQQVTLTFRCTPNAMGWHEGMLLFTTNLPDKQEFRFPISCAMKGNPDDPLAWRSEPPGPVSTGPTPPGGQSSAQISVGNQGVNPMSATISWKDAVADTLKFVTNLVGAAAPGSQYADVTVPAGQTLEILVTCTPNAPGLYANTLQITTNDPLSPVLDYDISCEGVTPPSPEPLAAVAISGELPAKQIMGMAISPDGTQLLAGHWQDTEMAVYSIPNPANGFLSKQPNVGVAGMGTITGIRYSSDGKNVYYSSSSGDGVVTLARAANGTLTHLQSITTASTYICGVISGGQFPILKFCPIEAMDGARALDISPDDRNVYVSGINDDTLTVLARNATDGQLYYLQKFKLTIEGVDMLIGPFGVLVSPDGKNVYVAARDSDSVVAFSRNQADGRLQYLTHYIDGGGATGLDGAVELALSPDGKFLYVASLNDDAVQIFARNPADGFITPVETVPVGDGPYHVLVSNDEEGERLVVALWLGDAVKVYRRDRVTGQITPLEGQSALTPNGPVFLVSTPDDRYVYAALYDGTGVQHLQSVRLAPLMNNLSPASAPAGGGDFTLTVNGSQFYPESAVLWNGAPLATSFVNDHQLRATVPGALIAAAGSANVQVRTAAPGGGDSAAQPIAILAADAAPVPSVASLSPSAIIYSGEPLNVLVTGAGFTAASQVLLNGGPVKTTYINGSNLLAQLSATDTTAAGPLLITVVNGGTTAVAGAGQQMATATSSSPVKFTVAGPGVPALADITAFSPSSAAAGSGEQWITVSGYNFSAVSGAVSVAYWNGAPRPTAVQDANTLKMQLSAADVAAAGTGAVSVYTPGAGESAPRTFHILPAGQNAIAEVGSVYVEFGPLLQVMVSGSDFVDGAEVRINGQPRPTLFVNPYVLAAAVTDADVKQGGLVSVVNPGTNESSAIVLAPSSLVYMPVVRR